MEGLNPSPEGVLGASEGAVGRDTKLGSAGATPVRHWFGVRGSCDIVGVADRTMDAIGPPLGNKPGFRQAFVLVTLKSVEQHLIN